jgi:hypothetical protein
MSDDHLTVGQLADLVVEGMGGPVLTDRHYAALREIVHRFEEAQQERDRLRTLAFLTAVDAVVWFHEPDGRTAKPQAFCSDTFAYATADGEDIPDDQVAVLADVYNRWHWAGVTAWVAWRRGTEPLDEHRVDPYLEARKYLEVTYG